jgi:predicted glutamine amidotransferase
MLDPTVHTPATITSAAKQLYDSMGSSLGVVAVIDNGDGTFDFPYYKRVIPDVDEVREFVDEHYDTVQRFIIHGRLATHGGRSQREAHPIEIECDECSIDYVIHNGVVYDHEGIRHQTESKHDYNTEVDSEVIAHDYSNVPDGFDDVIARYDREPCYILLSENRILIHTNNHYVMTEDATFARSYRTFAPELTDTNYKEIIMTPNAGGDN